MNTVARRKRGPRKARPKPLQDARVKALLSELSAGWGVKRRRLEKGFEFEDFRAALAFTNKVGALAEKQQHHPDIYLAWGEVKLKLWTHKPEGLTESDFLLAVQVDGIGRT